MTDTPALDPTSPDKPIVVSASTFPAAAQSIVAAIVIIMGAMPAFIAVLGTHDVTKMVAYAGSSAFVPVLGAVGVVVAIGTRAWQALKTHANVIKLLRLPSTPNSVGFVKGDPGTPAL